MLYTKCPGCGRSKEKDGFNVRGQCCICGWWRDGPKKASSGDRCSMADAEHILATAHPTWLMQPAAGYYLAAALRVVKAAREFNDTVWGTSIPELRELRAALAEWED